MEEIWKDIPQYEGYYQVSNYGNLLIKSSTTIPSWEYTQVSGNGRNPRNRIMI